MSEAPYYGIWTGTAWVRTSDGMVINSPSTGVLKTYFLDGSWSKAAITEIGADGNPVQPHTPVMPGMKSALLFLLVESYHRMIDDWREHYGAPNMAMVEACRMHEESWQEAMKEESLTA